LKLRRIRNEADNHDIKKKAHMLLDEIIAILSDTKGSVTGALLKTKVLLHKIGRQDLVPWVSNELTGYPDDNVPDYRILCTEVRGQVQTFRLLAKNQPLPILHLSEDVQKFLTRYPMTSSLQVIEESIQQRKTDSGEVHVQLPLEIVTLINPALGPGVGVISAWRRLDITEIDSVLVEVRSRLLDFALGLQDVVGEDATKLGQKIVGEEAGKLFEMKIIGSGNNVYFAHNSTQIVTVTNTKGDIEGLIQVLAKVGIPEDELKGLRTAIAHDEKKGLTPVISEGKTGHWFTKLLGRAANKTLDVGVDLVSSTVAKTLAAYGGMPA
jgi:hypothetical protein